MTLCGGVAISSPADYLGTAWKDASISTGISIEQAYVAWKPVDEVKIKVGKYGWKTNFNKAGVLWDEDVYKEGAFIKYKYDNDGQKYFVKVGAEKNVGNGDYKAPFAEDTQIYAKIGGMWEMDGVSIGAYAGVKTEIQESEDTAFKAGELPQYAQATTPTNGTDATDGDTGAPILVKIGASIDATDFQVPVGVFGTYVSDSDFGANQSYSVGAYVGSAGSVGPGDAGEFGVSVNYYDITATDYQVGYLNTDYGLNASSGAYNNGVAVRAQYNVFDNTNFVVKVGHSLVEEEAEGEATTVVGELNFNF